jgi:hypothetical protein
MTSHRDLGRALYDRGWRQGSIIGRQVPSQYVSSFDAPPVVIEAGDEGLVLITQDCDLVKAESKLPYLEAIPIRIDPELARRTRVNDSRYFVLDPVSGAVADRAHRIHLSRGALAGLDRPGPPCGGDTGRQLRFGQWLGSAYDRPALPDEFHPELSVPLTKAVEAAVAVGKPTEWLNDVLHEVRAASVLHEGPPWQVDLMFVLAEGAKQEECEEAIAGILSTAGLDGSDSGGRSVVVTSWRAAPLSQISVLEYAGSFPISLEMVSYAGEAVVGARPLRTDPA